MRASVLVTIQLRFTDTEGVPARIVPIIQAVLAAQGEHVSVSIQNYDDEDDAA